MTDNPVTTGTNGNAITDDATKAAVGIIGQSIGDGSEKSVYTADGSRTTGRADTNVYVFDNEDDWMAWSMGQTQYESDGKTVVNNDNMKKYVGNYDMVNRRGDEAGFYDGHHGLYEDRLQHRGTAARILL